jgi:high affinity Mn2+ porin
MSARTIGTPPRRRLIASLAFAAALLAPSTGLAAVAEPSGREDEAFDFMNYLAHRGVHDLDEEPWNAYGQVTDIWSLKLASHETYHGANSLSSGQEVSFTETATLFAGMRLWPGAQYYLVPEIIAEKALAGSDPPASLVGLGGVIQNFELQKQGLSTPVPYVARDYLRQTIDLGGDLTQTTSDPMQLGRKDRKRRIVLTLGNFSVLDFFDKNDTTGDLRKSFFNMAFLTYAAFDFAADARGYSWGGIAEIDWDDWAARVGRMAPPKLPNQLPLDFNVFRHYGDQAEIEHHHTIGGQDGAVRVLGYRNVEVMGRFADAIAVYKANPFEDAANAAASCANDPYSAGNGNAPDLCWVRRPNVKMGAGVSVEQAITDDIGAFFRGMYSDGQTEVYSFTSTDRSISVGSLMTGRRWKRGRDTLGLGYSAGWISSVHAQYLGLGGIDGFIGDGKIHQAPEQVLEAFYSLSMGSSSWFSFDYQQIWNPAYNADRGPVTIFGARIHAEF